LNIKKRNIQQGDVYSVTLPSPVALDHSTALVIAYSFKGYAKKSLGLFKFSFETFKVSSYVTKSKVTVDVDSDLYMEGKQSNVNYTTSYDSSEIIGDVGVATATGGNIEKIAYSIGNYGPVVKEAKSIAPQETFTVNGEYAKSKFRLYLSSVMTFVLVVVGLLLVIYFGSIFFKKENISVVIEEDNKFNIFDIKNIFLGLLSVVLTVALTLGVNFIGENLRMNDFVIAAGGFILMILLYIFFVFGIAIIVAVKHGGWKTFLSIFISEIFWGVLFFVMYVLMFGKLR